MSRRTTWSPAYASSGTSLYHSQVVGLWFTHWCTTLSDGDLTIDTTGVGTTVALDLPQGFPAPRSARPRGVYGAERPTE